MPLSAGSFGTITFIVPEILKIKIKESGNYIEIPVVNGFSRVHKTGDILDKISVEFRFSSMPGVGYNANAKAKLDLLRAEKGSLTAKTLTLYGENLGNFLVEQIDWDVVSQAGTMSPIVINAQVSFLQNPI